MAQELDKYYDVGNLADAGASATAQNLSRWVPRKGDGVTPPAPEIIGGALARWNAFLRSANKMSELGLDVTKAKVLEVGSGYGDGLTQFLLAGFRPANLTGIDLMPERLKLTAECLPGVKLVHGSGSHMAAFDSDTFDVVCEQFCFCHIPDADITPKIASEMLRVVKPGGFIFLLDWRMNASWRQIYGVTQKDMRVMFEIGKKTDLVSVFPSHLWPPVGNLLSRYARPFYPLVSLVPFLIGARLTLLRKKGAAV